MKEKDTMDIIIKQVFEEKMEKIDVPNMDDVWQNVDNSLNKSNKKNVKTWFAKRRKAIAAVIIICLIGSFLFSPDVGETRLIRLLKYIVNSNDGIVNVNINNKENEPGIYENNKDLKEPRTEELSLAELNSLSTFPVKKLTYVPEGYQFFKAVIVKNKDSISLVDIIYKANNGVVLTLNQIPIANEHSQSINLNSEEIVYKKIQLNDAPHFIIKQKNDNSIKIIWNINEVKCTLKGFLTESEMLKIVNGIK